MCRRSSLPQSSLYGIVPVLVHMYMTKSMQKKENRTNKIISEMRKKQNYSTNKPKSPEVIGQEQKVADNEQQAETQQMGSDGEIM